MKKVFFCFTLICILNSFDVQAQKDHRRRFDGTTSLIELIADGEKYEEKKVSIKGYFVDLQRRGRLFLHKDDADFDILGNSIIIEYNSVEGDFEKLASMSNKYISIEGIFYYGLGRLESGLSNISSFSVLQKTEKQ